MIRALPGLRARVYDAEVVTASPHAAPFEERGRPRPARPAGKPAGERREGARELLLCARCRAPITSAGDRIQVNGQHDYVFVNPHGFDYHVGCFGAAPGAIAHGPASHEFTWFSGFTWQLEHCRNCSAHLGWMYRSPRAEFHGLILDRLVEDDD